MATVEQIQSRYGAGKETMSDKRVSSVEHVSEEGWLKKQVRRVNKAVFGVLGGLTGMEVGAGIGAVSGCAAAAAIGAPVLAPIGLVSGAVMGVLSGAILTGRVVDWAFGKGKA